MYVWPQDRRVSQCESRYLRINRHLSLKCTQFPFACTIMQQRYSLTVFLSPYPLSLSLNRSIICQNAHTQNACCKMHTKLWHMHTNCDIHITTTTRYSTEYKTFYTYRSFFDNLPSFVVVVVGLEYFRCFLGRFPVAVVCTFHCLSHKLDTHSLYDAVCLGLLLSPSLFVFSFFTPSSYSKQLKATIQPVLLSLISTH